MAGAGAGTGIAQAKQPAQTGPAQQNQYTPMQGGQQGQAPAPYEDDFIPRGGPRENLFQKLINPTQGGPQTAQQQLSPSVMPPSSGTPASGGKGGASTLPAGDMGMPGFGGDPRFGGPFPLSGNQSTNTANAPSDFKFPSMFDGARSNVPQPTPQQYAEIWNQSRMGQGAGTPQFQPYTQGNMAQMPPAVQNQEIGTNPPPNPNTPPQDANTQPPNIFSTAAQGINQGIKAAGMETMYQPQTIAGTDLSAYMNPYESQVVDQSLQDLERARQMQANQLGAQASQAGAFGGSRQAIMESELGRNYLDQAARTASGLRQAGFQNAQQLAGQDIGFGLAGSQNRQAAANTLGNLSNLGFNQGMDLSNQAWQQGGLVQGINQMLIDAVKGQYGGYTGAPGQALGYVTGALGATPTPTTTTQSRQPGLFDYLTLGATMGR